MPVPTDELSLIHSRLVLRRIGGTIGSISRFFSGQSGNRLSGFRSAGILVWHRGDPG